MTKHSRSLAPIAKQWKPESIRWSTHRAEKCVIRCSFHVNDESEAQPQVALVTMKGADAAQLDHLPDSEYASRLGCVVELFPADWALPTLPSVMSPQSMTATLGEARDPGLRWRSPDVLHYRPHRRCVLLYRPVFANEADDVDVIVKVFPPGPSAALAADLIADLRPKAAAAGLNIPRPLGVSEPMSALIMERAAGISMKARLRASTSSIEAIGTSALVAEALSALHTLGPIPSARSRTLTSEIRRVRRHLTRLKIVAPELAGDVDALLNRIAFHDGQYPENFVSVCHGDFTLNQLLCDGDRVSMLDFDRASAGDAALDVGNLMAKLDREIKRSEHKWLEGMPEKFLEQYQTASGRTSGLVERAQLTRAFVHVQSAIRSFRHAPQEYMLNGSESRPYAYLREGVSVCP